MAGGQKWVKYRDGYCKFPLHIDSKAWKSYVLYFKDHGHNYTVSPKKTCDYIFYNNFNNKSPITIIFGIFSSKSMLHRKVVSFPTSTI